MIDRFGARALEALLDAVYPARCLARGCGRPGAWLCPACQARIRALPASRCPRCALPGPRAERCPACRHRSPRYARVHAVASYGPPLDQLVRHLKYRPAARLAPCLAGLMADRALPSAMTLDALVALPCHPRRARARGLDHTEALAAALAGRLGLPRLEAVVERRRNTAPQVGRSARARRANVAGAFGPGPAAERLRGRRVLLVDDVLTTGASADEAAACLLRSGASAVEVVVVARALPPRARDRIDHPGPGTL